MIQKLKHDLCQPEKKQAKGSKLCVNIRWEQECNKLSKMLIKVLER